LMTFAFLGFRTTVEATVPPSGGVPWMVAARTGPCLHLLPYHRVDLSAYIEGGAAGFGLFGRAAAAAPMVTPGGSLDIWLDPVLFLRFDGHIDWSVNNFGSAGQTYVQVVGGIGLGVGF